MLDSQMINSGNFIVSQVKQIVLYA